MLRSRRRLNIDLGTLGIRYWYLRQTIWTQFTAHLRMPLYRNGYALMLNSVTTSGLGVGYWIIATRLYSTDTVGLNSAAISAMMFLAGVAQLNLAGAEIRFLPAAGAVTRRFVTYAYIITLVVAAVVSLGFLQGLGIWAPKLASFGSNPGLKAWFVLATITWCMFGLQDSALTGMRQATWVPIKNFVFSVAKILLLAGLASSFSQYGVFASWTIGTLIILLPVNILIFRRLIPQHVQRSEGRTDPFSTKEVVSFVAADYVGSLFSLASFTLLPLIVTQEAGASANAYYYLSWQIAGTLSLVSNNMGTSLIVEAANDPAMLDKYTRRVFFQMARIVIPLTLILVLCAPYILRVFGAGYVDGATNLLRLLALSTIPATIVGLYTSVSLSRRHMKAVVALQIGSCGLVLVTSYFLLHRFGVAGAGLGWLISESFFAVILLFTPELHILRPSHRHRHRKVYAWEHSAANVHDTADSKEQH
jgi:O-antigen/teichoic acid export membrane protein